MPKETILLVDDERTIVDLARMYLEQESFKVEAAYDGQAEFLTEDRGSDQ